MHKQSKKQLITNKSFQIERIRRLNTRIKATEYLSILSMLYGTKIDSGAVSIQTYKNMTMLDAASEIKVRTMMLRGETNQKLRSIKETDKRKEADLLKRLKELTSH